MKFNCGLTKAQRLERLSEWHPWFAWHPVRVASEDCRWLEVVQRRRIGPHHFANHTWRYQA